jgi:hypothetical protein
VEDLEGLEVGEVLLGDPLDGDVVDIDLVLLDEIQEEIEGALENLQFDFVLRLHQPVPESLAAVAPALDFAGDADLVFGLLLDLRLPLSELGDEFVNAEIDGGVEIVLGILGMEVGTRNGEVDLHLIVLLLGAVLVKEKNHMGGQDLVVVLFKMGHLVGHMGMDGGGELDVTWADMDLHGLVFLIPF